MAKFTFILGLTSALSVSMFAATNARASYCANFVDKQVFMHHPGPDIEGYQSFTKNGKADHRVDEKTGTVTIEEKRGDFITRYVVTERNAEGNSTVTRTIGSPGDRHTMKFKLNSSCKIDTLYVTHKQVSFSLNSEACDILVHKWETGNPDIRKRILTKKDKAEIEAKTGMDVSMLDPGGVDDESWIQAVDLCRQNKDLFAVSKTEPAQSAKSAGSKLKKTH